jgi:hypothetical protein
MPEAAVLQHEKRFLETLGAEVALEIPGTELFGPVTGWASPEY